MFSKDPFIDKKIYNKKNWETKKDKSLNLKKQKQI